jgi:hypothetical protein
VAIESATGTAAGALIGPTLPQLPAKALPRCAPQFYEASAKTDCAAAVLLVVLPR